MEEAMSRLVLSRKVGIRRVSVVIPDFPGNLPGCQFRIRDNILDCPNWFNDRTVVAII